MGWGGNFRGPKIKSPGNVTNCPEKKKLNPGGGGVGWRFYGSKFYELPRKSINFTPPPGAGGRGPSEAG